MSKFEIVCSYFQPEKAEWSCADWEGEGETKSYTIHFDGTPEEAERELKKHQDNPIESHGATWTLHELEPEDDVVPATTG